jgi:hypothetical protein
VKPLAGALVALVALGVSPAASVQHNGLYGLVTRGPITPVCVAGRPCSAPARNVLLRFVPGRGTAATTRTDATGHYRVPLGAGRYHVSAGTGRLTPALVRVPLGRFAHVDLSIDTGIR